MPGRRGTRSFVLFSYIGAGRHGSAFNRAQLKPLPLCLTLKDDTTKNEDLSNRPEKQVQTTP